MGNIDYSCEEYLDDESDYDLDNTKEAQFVLEQEDSRKNSNFKNNAQCSNRSFNISQKVQIIRAVRNNSIIWNKTEKGHSTRTAISAAWRSVSEIVQRPGKQKYVNFFEFI